jgi:NAD(P)-dependent dehydrogenase (short-subunit alcohol dehydrogenase family)
LATKSSDQDVEATVAGSCVGRIALVTGASRGIGKGTAIRLAAEGADVAVLARSLDAVQLGWSMGQTVAEIEGLGRRALAIEADLGDPSVDRGAVIDQVEAELGPLDILVNNAAAGGYKYFADWDDSELRRMQEVNVWAPWQFTRRVLQGMRERKRGWVLNISSAAAEIPAGPPFSSSMVARRGTAYGSTKAMLNRFTASLAVELHGTGIAVNALSPQAATATEGVLASIETGRIKSEQTEPLETMVEAALALCTGDPDTLTGQIAYSLDLLRVLGRVTYDLYGIEPVEGWGPEDLPERIKIQEAARR